MSVQEDLVHDELTVRENLSYAAALKLPPDMPPSRRAAIVDDVLDVLMLRPVQDYVVGCIEARGISGGQRKRVNLGLELVGMPSLLFLDEPTSGLDATSGYDIMMALSDMAALGMTVVAVVHQPRFASFLLFDQVLMLGATGRPVYMGPPVLAPYYFRHLQFAFPLNENPADVIMDVIAGRVARQGESQTCRTGNGRGGGVERQDERKGWLFRVLTLPVCSTKC